MARSSAYIEPSRHNVFYFRIRVPQPLRSLIPCAEIRRSLQTKCRREAVLRSAALLDEVHSMFSTAGKGQGVDLTNLSWSHPTASPVPVSLSPPQQDVTPAKPATPKLSRLLTVFLKFQQLEGVGIKTIKDKEAVVSLLIKVVGDKPVGQIGRDEARRFKETALRLPPRFDRIKGKSLNEIIDKTESTISVTTFNNYVKNLSTVFTYAERQGYIERNPFEGLKLKRRQKLSAQRHRFDTDDLTLLFSTDNYTKQHYKHPYQYWLPLMGLLTGARLNELSQLYIADFDEVNGIKCIHFQAKRPNQRLKTLTAERLVPIHPKLLELGLWNFVLQLKQSGVQRLFPELRHHRTNGYAHYATKWFMTYRESLGLKGGDKKKDFHSFRHTVADHLKQKGIQESLIAGVLGHQTGGVTFGRYGKDYRPEVLEPVVAALEFDLSTVVAGELVDGISTLRSNE